MAKSIEGQTLDAIKDIAEQLKILNTGIATGFMLISEKMGPLVDEVDIPSPEDPIVIPDDPDWVDKYQDPIFSGSTQKRWVTPRRGLWAKVHVKNKLGELQYNAAGSPIIKVRQEQGGIELLADKKVLVYGDWLQADGAKMWELCDPAGTYVAVGDIKITSEKFG